MSEESEAHIETQVKSQRRYWQRTDSARPWWPWGFLPMLGLVLLFLFGAMVTAPRIEAEIRAQVSDRFDGAGVIAADVSSNGQGVSVTTGSQPVDITFLNALAKSTQCDTWAGSLTCPTSVVVDVDETGAAPAVLMQRPHAFTVVREQDAVRLTGEVPDFAEHDRILQLAGQHFGAVTNELSVSNEKASDDFSHAADVSLAVVTRLSGGQAAWSGQSLSVNGVANADAVAAARGQFEAMGSGGLLGDFDVQVLDDRANCDKRFDEILSTSTIRFQTASSTIDDGNDELLARLAEAARQCDGELTVEGHTDSRGDSAMNHALSVARALAVRDALAKHGIDANRVTATGFGANQPIADNSTADGRARNRRIVIRTTAN